MWEQFGVAVLLEIDLVAVDRDGGRPVDQRDVGQRPGEAKPEAAVGDGALDRRAGDRRRLVFRRFVGSEFDVAVDRDLEADRGSRPLYLEDVGEVGPVVGGIDTVAVDGNGAGAVDGQLVDLAAVPEGVLPVGDDTVDGAVFDGILVVDRAPSYPLRSASPLTVNS